MIMHADLTRSSLFLTLRGMKTPARAGVLLALLIISVQLPTHAQNLTGDEALSKVLIDSEGWQVVAEGYQFTDAACADAAGNFYFTDVAKGTTINKISPDGKVSPVIENTPRISGASSSSCLGMSCSGGDE